MRYGVPLVSAGLLGAAAAQGFNASRVVVTETIDSTVYICPTDEQTTLLPAETSRASEIATSAQSTVEVASQDASNTFYAAPTVISTQLESQASAVTDGTVVAPTESLTFVSASTAPAVTVSDSDDVATSVEENNNIATSDVASSVFSSIVSSAASSAATSDVASSVFSSVVSSAASSAAPSATAVTNGDCSQLCSQLEFSSPDVRAWTCTRVDANVETDTAPMQSEVGCAATFTPPVDICRVTMTIATSDQTTTYMEVFLPDAADWNGRIMNSDNGGVNGCVHYVDMTYVLGKGFAVAGDNGGHNSSSFDGRAFQNNRDAVLDWSYRSRHEAAIAGKEVVNSYYSNDYSYSYYLGCSTGGRQGLKSAQEFPNDFDGIIAGSSAADFNNLEYATGQKILTTGTDESDPRFLTFPQWELVHQANLDQCDEALDGVADGIIEDPTLCMPTFDSITCENSDDENCLTQTQLNTVNTIFSPILSPDGNELIFPRMQPGSEIDAWKLGQLSGSVQAIVQDWFRYAVLNNDTWDPLDLTYDDLQTANSLDAANGYVSSFNTDLFDLQASGSKLLMYHGMADPSISGLLAQRYYISVANTMGLGYEELDDFFRFFRISGQAHCSIGGVSGEGAWEIGQSGPGSTGEGNVIDSLVDWVENGNAPQTILGTKFNDDTESEGIQMVRPHCRFPFRTTYNGGDATAASGWDCVFIENWDSCDGSDGPRMC